MESTRCDLCNSNDFEVARQEKQFEDGHYSGDKWYPVLTCICKNCGHIYTNPKPTQEELAEFYSRQLRESFQVSRGEKVGLNAADAAYLTEVVGRGENRKAIEIGSYTGYMLNHLHNAGWDVEGLEPNVDSAQRSRELFDFLIHVDTLENFEAAQKYDLVFAGGVLEHVSSPSSFLGKINAILNVGGYVYIRVPNIESTDYDTAADLFIIEHLHNFSQKSLEMFFEKMGFKLVATSVHDKFRRSFVGIGQKVAEVDNVPAFNFKSQYHEMSDRLAKYDQHINEERRKVDTKIRRAIDKGQTLAVYGAGTHTEFLFRYTSLGQSDLKYVIDSNPKKAGIDFMGHKVIQPLELKHKSIGAIVISSRAFQEEIFEKLKYLEPLGIELIRLYDVDKSKYRLT